MRTLFQLKWLGCLTLLGLAQGCSPDMPITRTLDPGILIYSLSTTHVKKQEGALPVRISSYSAIKNLSINDQSYSIPPDTRELTLRLPYQLKPDQQTFAVLVDTVNGSQFEELVLSLNSGN